VTDEFNRPNCPLAPRDGEPWTPAIVRARLEEALGRGGVLHRLEMRGTRPAPVMSSQLQVVRSAVEAYGYDASINVRVLPTADEIDRTTQVLEWLLWLATPARQLVAARAMGVKWRRLERQFFASDRTLQKRYKLAIVVIVGRLNRPKAQHRSPAARIGHSPLTLPPDGVKRALAAHDQNGEQPRPTYARELVRTMKRRTA